jgi:phosphoribosylformimino-5-aminoimidazole carboxamide ribotide isomerase
MQIIPVLDLKGGRVVRGVGGRREEYQPMRSALIASSDPRQVAAAFRDRFGLNELYLADLDAIAGGRHALMVYQAIRELSCGLWVDAGLRRAEDAEGLAQAGVDGIVVGLETIRDPAELSALCRAHDKRVIFSLDLKGGVPLGDLGGWTSRDPWSIAGQAVGLGVRRLVVLDLARVGEGSGPGTEELCARLVAAFPDVKVFAGGGVRGLDDLLRLQRLGLHGVLVASALHDGSLRPEALQAL